MSSPSSSVVSPSLRKYTSLFNPDEIQSNQEAQNAATGGNSSYSDFGHVEKLEDYRGRSEMRGARGQDSDIPRMNEIGDSDDEDRNRSKQDNTSTTTTTTTTTTTEEAAAGITTGAGK
ncbi:hypothetical protein GY632_1944 [Trichophyton interdigitale]|uniref:Uncharacterized protein n=1 Tax=Trichophyton interdigitale TaxID=101480 RepID=A0A9P4YKH9_9EURO|nr:hypothetical protein GY632_1944 [Trichophyton interdigitale]